MTTHLTNAQLYERDPLRHELANNGVAQVDRKADEDRRAFEKTLRFELENFICEGEYQAGIERLLNSFIDRLRTGEQPTPAWLSGFFGAGKSHLAKMLAALWVNYVFEDGATALSLAVHLPTSIRDLLKELYVEGKKAGGLHVASGLLGSDVSGRAMGAILGVVFKSRGLPPQVNTGRFALWLKEQDYHDAVKKAVEASGKAFDSALLNLAASKEIRQTLAKLDPGLGGEDNVRELLRTQFVANTAIDADLFEKDVERALKLGGGQIPLTLLILDEVQQFIGTDSARSLEVQQVAELCQSAFKGRVQLLATGQSAMGATAELQKLKGRFPVLIHLTDTDVESVIRKTVLRKSIQNKPVLEQTLDAASGEISRHLAGTRIASDAKDAGDLAADYPILPTRRRFFEAVLRALDPSGAGSQLRGQLRIAYEAAKKTAPLPVGNVIGGDHIFDELQASQNFHNICPNELLTRIRRLEGSQDADERLMARVMKLIFFINRLPHDDAADLGVRATEDTLADLLVTDLTKDSSALRARMPQLLKRLEDEHNLVMAIVEGGRAVYREKTQESASWYADFKQFEQEMRVGGARVGTKRAELLKEKIRAALASVKAKQGQMNLIRELDVSFDSALPASASKRLTVWVQDGWQTTQKSVEREAQAAGLSSSTLFVFIPERDKSDLSDAIVQLQAAEATLNKRGTPQTPAGQDAQKMMERKVQTASDRIDEILKQALADATVYSSGGAAIEGADLAQKVQTGVNDALPRMYPRFAVADQKDWNKVLDKARDGHTDALSAVGHQGDAEAHPVCKELLSYFGTSGKKGAEVQDRYENAPYGWPRDAIQGAALALLANGLVKARDANGAYLTAKQVERNQFTKLTFICEQVQVTVKDKLNVMSVLKKAGIPCSPGEELAKAALLGPELHKLRMAAGGDAPLPNRPPTTLIEDIERASGNAQLLVISNSKDVISQAIDEWRGLAERIKQRKPAWDDLESMLGYAAPLPASAAWMEERNAVVEQRALLDTSNPVATLKAKVESGLREALNKAAEDYAAEFAQQMQALESEAEWQKFTDAQRASVMAQVNVPASYPVNTGSADAILQELATCDLQRWRDRIAALAGRFEQVRKLIAEMLEPKAVHVSLPRSVLRTEADVRAWLVEVENRLLQAVKNSPIRV